MFCIAAFIVLGILSIFSARHRVLAKQAWACVIRRVTLRPCDSNFKETTKAALLSRIAHKGPHVIRAADIALDMAAFAVLLLTVWSLFVAVKSGINLYVYGTCNPSNASSCSLGAQACSIDSNQPGFWRAIREGDIIVWFGHEFSQFGESISLIPSRWKNWNAVEYLPANASYYQTYDPSKPTAVEIIDPGCQFCAQLFYNTKLTDFAGRFNLSYIPYAIPDSSSEGGYKFRHSLLIVSYLEAIRRQPAAASLEQNPPADWFVLERVFTGSHPLNVSNQQAINTLLNKEQVEQLLNEWLVEYGYTEQELTALRTDAVSNEVANLINANKQLVTERINTVKIPTLLFNGRRYHGVVQPEDLQ